MDYRYGSHTVFKVQFHFVFVTKYRHKVLKGDVGLKVRELIRQTCEAFEIEILKGVVSRIMSSVGFCSPNLASSEIMGWIRKKLDEVVREFPWLEKALLGAT